jgi:MFS family permease
MASTNTGAGNDTEIFVSWREFLGSPYAASLALVCLAVWLHAADSLIVATMLPSIVAEIGGAALVGWSVSLYEIGSIVAGAASALLTMRFSLRAPMSMAAILFGFGCILSAVSPTMPLLLMGRALQGLGGGGLVAMGFVAVGLIFPRRYIARAMAAVSTLWGVSAFAGPLVGGFFVEYATWRWGFAFFACQAFALAHFDQRLVHGAGVGAFLDQAELDLLPALELGHAAGQRAAGQEHVTALVAGDEPIALCSVVPLDSTRWHRRPQLWNFWLALQLAGASMSERASRARSLIGRICGIRPTLSPTASARRPSSPRADRSCPPGRGCSTSARCRRSPASPGAGAATAGARTTGRSRTVRW